MTANLHRHLVPLTLTQFKYESFVLVLRVKPPEPHKPFKMTSRSVGSSLHTSVLVHTQDTPLSHTHKQEKSCCWVRVAMFRLAQTLLSLLLSPAGRIGPSCMITAAVGSLFLHAWLLRLLPSPCYWQPWTNNLHFGPAGSVFVLLFNLSPQFNC